MHHSGTLGEPGPTGAKTGPGKGWKQRETLRQ